MAPETLRLAVASYVGARDVRVAPWPKERERWFAFRDQCLRDAMQEWLTAHEIEPTTTPPGRSS